MMLELCAYGLLTGLLYHRFKQNLYVALVGAMLGGRVVEEGLTDQILEDPLHAYTQTLVSSLL